MGKNRHALSPNGTYLFVEGTEINHVITGLMETCLWDTTAIKDRVTVLCEPAARKTIPVEETAPMVPQSESIFFFTIVYMVLFCSNSYLRVQHINWQIAGI